jgi:hypothetical protein
MEQLPYRDNDMDATDETQDVNGPNTRMVTTTRTLPSPYMTTKGDETTKKKTNHPVEGYGYT